MDNVTAHRTRKPETEAAPEVIHLNELAATDKPKQKPGPKPKPETELVINLGICGTRADLELLATYNNSSPTAGFRELVDETRKVHPNGRFSVPTPPPGCKDRPGTKTTLKREKAVLVREKDALARRIDLLEKQLRKAGMEPVKE